jgi:hypothetical protein
VWSDPHPDFPEDVEKGTGGGEDGGMGLGWVEGGVGGGGGGYPHPDPPEGVGGDEDDRRPFDVCTSLVRSLGEFLD